MMLHDVDSDEVDESGVESGNNSDSETGNESLNAGNSEGSDSASHHHSTSETVPTATFDIDSDRGNSSVATMLPWGARKETSPHHVDTDIRPGEFVMRTLFTEFCMQAERKIEAVLAEPPEKPLSKLLQRGEDAQFDQLLSTFGSGAEHCLPSMLRALFSWYERQMGEPAQETKKVEQKGKSENSEKTEIDPVQEKRDLAVEFLLCLVLIEVLKQLSLHPGHEDLVTYIENLSFKHFKYREGQGSGNNAANFHTVADLYAEVLGALAQSRFLSVRNRFLAELKELRGKEPSPHATQSIISLLMGMKFFRVKMVPIEEFEASFQFMQECAQYFLEVRDKDIKHALAGLFVEILVPVAASVKNEVNVPCLKNFVESLYTQTLDMCTKSKHRLALFPLVTCLLCVSQKTFFLSNWHYFLAMCLSHLKNRDPKMSRVALESLYRLLWVYMIRIKCESNSATQSRLQSIVHSLFPKGSKAVVPRDTPLNIFVKIIQFIAQERLDFAMREIVFDLLSVGRPFKVILTPERMSIGLRAFLVVADSLQQKEGEPPMPRTSGVLPSGNTLRVKKTFLNKMLTEDTARSIGMSPYFPHVRMVFVDMLRALDTHYGRPLMMTCTQNVNKEPDEMITGERKPRIDLFRTCVAAVPRLIPDGITSTELIDLLARLTVHMDEELRGLAYQSLQTLVIDFPDWRHDVILGFTQFLSRDVPDTSPQLLDNGLRMLLQLLTSWKNAVSKDPVPVPPQPAQLSPTMSTPRRHDHPLRLEPAGNVLHHVEGFALVMLCSVRLCPRRLSIHILREAKILLKLLGGSFDADEALIDMMERWCPTVLETCTPLLPAAEKTAMQSATLDMQWIADRTSSVWTAGIQDESSSKSNAGGSSSSVCVTSGSSDPWAMFLFGLIERGRVLAQCSSAVTHSWPIVYTRLHMLYSVIDPTPVSDNRASLLRSSAPPRRPVTERDMYLVVWRNYACLAMRVVPPAPSPVVRCASPDLSLSSSPDSLTTERNEKGTSVSPPGLYKLLIPLLRCEVHDVRDSVVYALAKVNCEALKDLMEELVGYIREAVDRKQENMRRRRRRDALRLQLVRTFELIAQYGTFGNSTCVLDRDSQSLHPTIVEYIDGARLCLEMEPDKDALADIKLHFCNFIRHMLKSFPLEMHHRLLKRDLRRCLFSLFASWAGPHSKGLGNLESLSAPGGQDIQFVALQSMTAVLCCGPCFDPQSLSEDGALYPWIDHLLASDDHKVYSLACETVILLLECNPDIGSLLDWVVDRCYTAKAQVADGCFNALTTIFSVREYPCDHYTAVINVTLMNTGCPRTEIQEQALQLLQILDKRFFGAVGPLPADGEPEHEVFNLEILESADPEEVARLPGLSFGVKSLYKKKWNERFRPGKEPLLSTPTHTFSSPAELATDSDSSDDGLHTESTSDTPLPVRRHRTGRKRLEGREWVKEVLVNSDRRGKDLARKVEQITSLTKPSERNRQLVTSITDNDRKFASKTCLNHFIKAHNIQGCPLIKTKKLQTIANALASYFLDLNPDVWLTHVAKKSESLISPTCSKYSTARAQGIIWDQYQTVKRKWRRDNAEEHRRQQAEKKIRIEERKSAYRFSSQESRDESPGDQVTTSRRGRPISDRRVSAELQKELHAQEVKESIARLKEDETVKTVIRWTEFPTGADVVHQSWKESHAIRHHHLSLPQCDVREYVDLFPALKSPSEGPRLVEIDFRLQHPDVKPGSLTENLRKIADFVYRKALSHGKTEEVKVLLELYASCKGDKNRSTLDVLLSSTYCRSQMHLSRQLAELHPELTMPMFSEITHRFQTARPEVRQLLLGYLLPWLYNMELVDPNVPPANPLNYFQYCGDSARSGTGMRREGWGSVEATEMVLNNLFYITAKFADQHAKEIEEVWATLSHCWPNNLKVIIRYLLIISGMAPNELLQYAKRVVVYLARAKTDRLLDEMMTELHTVETLNWLIERTETPPFYRLTSMRKASSHSDPGQPETSRELTTERGTIHTKRHSGEDPAKGTCKSDTLITYGFTPPRGPDKIRTASGPPGLLEEVMTPNADNEVVPMVLEENARFDIPQPHPLPMPEYGGYFAPLTEYLPDSSQPSTGFHRCNVAVMLLTDVVVDVPHVDWSIHLPLMLHILFLGLDHSRTLVHQHCKQILLNLLIVLSEHNDHLAIAQILLNRQTIQIGLGLTTPSVPVLSHNFTEPDADFDSCLQGVVVAPPNSAALPPGATSPAPSTEPVTPPVIVVAEESNVWVPPAPGPNMPLREVIKSLIDFIASRENQVIWNYEDITAKVWSVRSVEQMEVFLQHVLRIFRESLPHALISERWGEIALQLGLSCSSRHYAGRSLQIFRALHLPISSRMLSEILSRLVETVAEQGEDMQGYVTELLLTLEAAVDSLESDFRPLDFMKEIFKSTPNLNNKEGAAGGKRSPGAGIVVPGGVSPLGGSYHMRSTSYSVSYCGYRKVNATPTQPANIIDNKLVEVRGRLIPESVESRCSSASKYTATNLCRSRSAQSLKLLGDSATQDDKMTILAQLFWLSLSLLQSDYEHEFLLALRLLDRLLHRLPLDRPDARDKVDKLQSQLKWNNFPGLHALLLKGCTNATTYEPVTGILVQCTPLLHLPVVDPTQNLAFPMNVIALLPYMILHYEDANPLCILAAENIAQVSNEKGKKLENLGTVMTLYSRRTFSKESFQWTKCVVKYLNDTYAHLSPNMLAFLVEVLEKGPSIVQLPVLSIIHCMLHYVDLSNSSAQPLYADLLKVIAKYIEGAHWKEALKILKLVVKRSSTLPVPSHHTHWEPSPHLSFTDAELFNKKELPGRTMDFTFDVTETPLIGKKAKLKKEEVDLNASPRRSVSLSPADNLTMTGWKRPWVSQGRVRESMVNLLTACGQRVGLPKSPSVIFSQSSEVLERQSSVASSTEEVSGPDLSAGSQNPDHFGVFKDFDFLEYESESVEGESTDNFNWGVRRRVLSEGEGEIDPALRVPEESLSETTPVLSTRKLHGVGEGVEESSDDEVGSESPLDELVPGEFAPTSPGGGPPYTNLSLALRDRSNSTTHSDTSGSSAGDLGELTPCNASPNLSTILQFRPITRHDSEEAWRTHIQSLVSHLPTSPLHLFHILFRTMKDVIKKSVTINKEACLFLTEVVPGENMCTQLQSLTDLLVNQGDPPLAWFSPDKVANPRLAERLRFGMLVLQEHIDTFLDRKEQVTECIETMKMTIKLQETADIGAIVEMGKCLYKFHLQLVMLIEAADKMYSILTTTAEDNGLQNRSPEVILMKKELHKIDEDPLLSTGDTSPIPWDSETLLHFLKESKWSLAMSLARSNRGLLASDAVVTAPEEDDVTNILNVYCCHLVKDIPDVFIITEESLSEVLTGLRQGLIQVLATVSALEVKVKASDKTLVK